jgi:hypothetical protein
MKALKLTCISLLVLLSVSCVMNGKRVKGNGKVVTENRTVSSAKKINVLGSMDVVLAVGQPSVKVEGDENILKYILIEERDGWLDIRTRDNMNIDTKNNIVVYVTTPALTQLKITGSGDVRSDGKFTSSEDMSFSLTGSGNLIIPFNAPRVTVAIAGSGDMTASGETRDVKVSIAGSGNFNGQDLKAENADMNIAGSGDAYIFADVRLKAHIMGSGSVHYTGNAAIEKNVMGSGVVAKAD